jgi:hypothetical protein
MQFIFLTLAPTYLQKKINTLESQCPMSPMFLLLRSLKTNADTSPAFLPSFYSQAALGRHVAPVAVMANVPQTPRSWM